MNEAARKEALIPRCQRWEWVQLYAVALTPARHQISTIHGWRPALRPRAQARWMVAADDGKSRCTEDDGAPIRAYPTPARGPLNHRGSPHPIASRRPSPSVPCGVTTPFPAPFVPLGHPDGDGYYCRVRWHTRRCAARQSWQWVLNTLLRRPLLGSPLGAVGDHGIASVSSSAEGSGRRVAHPSGAHESAPATPNAPSRSGGGQPPPTPAPRTAHWADARAPGCFLAGRRS